MHKESSEAKIGAVDIDILMLDLATTASGAYFKDVHAAVFVVGGDGNRK